MTHKDAYGMIYQEMVALQEKMRAESIAKLHKITLTRRIIRCYLFIGAVCCICFATHHPGNKDAAGVILVSGTAIITILFFSLISTD